MGVRVMLPSVTGSRPAGVTCCLTPRQEDPDEGRGDRRHIATISRSSPFAPPPVALTPTAIAPSPSARRRVDAQRDEGSYLRTVIVTCSPPLHSGFLEIGSPSPAGRAAPRVVPARRLGEGCVRRCRDALWAAPSCAAPVRCYAFLGRWLPSSPRPGGLCGATESRRRSRALVRRAGARVDRGRGLQTGPSQPSRL